MVLQEFQENVDFQDHKDLQEKLEHLVQMENLA